MDLIQPFLIDSLEEKIHDFIKSVSGLSVLEQDTEQKYTLSLGNYNRIEIGFWKEKHPQIKDFRFSAYVKMLEVFTEKLKVYK